MNKINIDWQRFGNSLLNTMRASSGPIVTGIGMIGLALLCKKLDIPYQVLLDPAYSTRTAKITQFPQQNTSPFMLMPKNSAEAAIGAIYDGLANETSDYYRLKGAEKIFDMLSESSCDPNDGTKTYTIMVLNNIAKSTVSSYYSNKIMDLIAKIGTGDY